MLARSWSFGVIVLCVACGGAEDRKFGNTDAGSGGSAGSGAAGAGGNGATGGASGSGGATGGASGSGGAAGGTGGAAGCNTTTHVCAPSNPAGWTGPVAFYLGASAPPSCPGAYPTPEADGKANVVAGAPSCACSCDPATGVTCSSGTAAIYDVGEGVAGCTVNPTPYPKVWEGSLNSCVKALANATGQVALVRPNPTTVGSCAAKANHTIPPPTFDQARLCAGAATGDGACDGNDVCLPQAFDPYRVCVHRPGEFECPAGYTDKTVVHEDFTDTRACTSCSCGATNATCGGSVDFVTASTCVSGTAQAIVSGCGNPGQNLSVNWYGRYTPQPSGTCTASASSPSGDITPSGTRTVCCLP